MLSFAKTRSPDAKDGITICRSSDRVYPVEQCPGYGHVVPQNVGTSETQIESHAELQQNGSAPQMLPAHGSQVGVSGPPVVQSGCEQVEPVPPSAVPASGVPASGVPASGVPASGVPASVGVPPPVQNVEPQKVGTSETQIESHATLQQKGSCGHTALAHELQLGVSGPPGVHSGCAQVPPTTSGMADCPPRLGEDRRVVLDQRALPSGSPARTARK